MIYKFKAGFRLAACNPQAVGEELEHIRTANDGRLLPEDVVKAAADPHSPLHPAFNWDDVEAARLYRHEQATYLVRAIITIAPSGEAPQKAFYNVAVVNSETKEPERYYQSAAVISRSPKEYASALKVMLTELSGAEIGLQQLQRIAPKDQRMNVRRAQAHVLEAHRTLNVDATL